MLSFHLNKLNTHAEQQKQGHTHTQKQMNWRNENTHCFRFTSANAYLNKNKRFPTAFFVFCFDNNEISPSLCLSHFIVLIITTAIITKISLPLAKEICRKQKTNIVNTNRIALNESSARTQPILSKIVNGRDAGAACGKWCLSRCWDKEENRETERIILIIAIKWSPFSYYICIMRDTLSTSSSLSFRNVFGVYVRFSTRNCIVYHFFMRVASVRFAVVLQFVPIYFWVEALFFELVAGWNCIHLIWIGMTNKMSVVDCKSGWVWMNDNCRLGEEYDCWHHECGQFSANLKKNENVRLDVMSSRYRMVHFGNIRCCQSFTDLFPKAHFLAQKHKAIIFWISIIHEIRYYIRFMAIYMTFHWKSIIGKFSYLPKMRQ